MMQTVFIAAFLLVLVGVLLIRLAAGKRHVKGLGKGETVALDDVTLYSERLKLVGRPDRIIRDPDTSALIPEEWKSSKRINQGHKLQLGAYFLLIEEEFGERPPHGVVVLGDGSRVEVENTERLRTKVLDVAEKIREYRRNIQEEIPVRQPAAKCRACGQRENCSQVSSGPTSPVRKFW